MTLRSNYHLVLNHNANEPTKFSVDSFLSAGGSDGNRALTCKTTAVMFLPQYIGQQCLSQIHHALASYHSANHHSSIISV